MYAEIPDPILRAAVIAQRVYAGDVNLTFIAAVPKESRAVAFYTPVTKAPAAILTQQARAAFAHMFVTTSEVIQIVDQITQSTGGGRSAQDRAQEIAETADAEYFDHEENPLITIYLRPCTTDATDLERLNYALRKKRLDVGLFAFTPKSRDGTAQDCVLCKYDNHMAYVCPFPRSTPMYWGPPAQLSQLTTGIFANRGRGRGGAPRGGRGGRGGHPHFTPGPGHGGAGGGGGHGHGRGGPGGRGNARGGRGGRGG